MMKKVKQMKNDLKTINVLEVKNLKKEFKIGSFTHTRIIHAVNGIDLEIKEKEIVGLVGESGSGKTTVAKLIARLYNPTSGRFLLNGKEIPKKMSKRELLKYRKHVQMIFQDPFSSLNPLHTIGYTLSRPLKVHKIKNERKIEKEIGELLEGCGLTPAGDFINKYPYELSGGQMQRVGIARALAVNPQIVLADEPTSMLDVSIRLDIMNLMLDLKERNDVSYLFITHDLAGAHYMSDRIAIMYAGFIKATLRMSIRPRCPFTKKECTKRLPNMVQIDKDRFVRCVLYYK